MVETMERQERYRDRYETSTKKAPNSKKKERKINNNQSLLFTENQIPENTQLSIEQIGHLHPANSHMKSVALPIIQQQAIAEAIERDGIEIVLSGTKNLAEKISGWSPSELRFVPNPLKFYREGEYLKNPAFWERKKENGREECTRHPDSGRTQWGTCWACYSEECSSQSGSA
jgi:hypothetical protein